ncbi:solute carrier family 2, facilitated glucose transporter member 3-like [Argonauta hians]
MRDQGHLTKYLAFCTFVSVLGNSLIYGYNIGVINTPSQLIMEFYREIYHERNNKYPTQMELNFQWSITVAIFVAFGMIGSFVSGIVSDKCGRKKGMILITGILFLGAATGGACKYVKSPEVLMVSRLLVGIHSGLNIGLCPVYLAEISPKEIRGAISTCHQLAITIGILVSQILGVKELMGTEDAWPFLFMFMAVPGFVFLILMPFCPESPRYLHVNLKKPQEAEKVLAKLRNRSDVGDEIKEMVEEASKVTQKPFKVMDLLVSPQYRVPLLVACMLMLFQQWSGINAVFSYSSFIFEQAQLKKEVIPYAIVGTGVTNVIATIFAVSLMEKVGRRPLLLSPPGVMAVAMLVLSVLLYIQEGLKDSGEVSPVWMGYMCIGIMLVYVIGFAVGLGPIPFNIVSELFTQGPRAAAMSMALVVNWVTNFTLMLVFPAMQVSMGPFTFIIFIVIIIFAVFFVFFLVPETKGKSFEEIQQIMAAGKVWRKH